MNIKNESNLQFSYTFFYYVKYVGNCDVINQSIINNDPLEISNPWHQIPLVCITFIAFTLNALSLIVFIFGEKFMKQLNKNDLGDLKYSMRSSNTITNRINTKSQKNKLRKFGKKCSSFMTSLLTLCACETSFTLFTFLFKILHVTQTTYIYQKPSDTTNHVPPDLNLLIMPVIVNLFGFLADVSLACRNWCVCLITAARAEVVIWPLGSKLWQRVLRHPRRFKIIFTILLLISIVIYYFKHADLIGFVCYEQKTNSYAMWGEDYLFTYEAYSRYISFVVFPYQVIISWFLIIVFSILIIVRLQPWKLDQTLLHNDHSKSLEDIPYAHEHAQKDAIRKRQKGQIRATRVVIVVAVTFGLLESVGCFGSLAQTFKLLKDQRLGRILETVCNTLVTLDSICNFFIFISMMPYFRHLFELLFCCNKTKHSDSIPSLQPTQQTIINSISTQNGENNRVNQIN